MADQFSLEISGIDSLKRRLSPKNFREGMASGMQKGVLGMERKLRENLSGPILKRDLGGLVRASFSRVEEESDEVVGEVGNTARWRYRFKSGSLLEVHEEGAVIRPRKRGGFLRFKIDGKEIFAKKAVIPARKPLERSIKSRVVATQNIIRTALLRKLRGERLGIL